MKPLPHNLLQVETDFYSTCRQRLHTIGVFANTPFPNNNTKEFKSHSLPRDKTVSFTVPSPLSLVAAVDRCAVHAVVMLHAKFVIGLIFIASEIWAHTPTPTHHPPDIKILCLGRGGCAEQYYYFEFTATGVEWVPIDDCYTVL